MTQGVIEESSLQGWTGDSLGSTPEDIIQNVSLIRTPKDCPLTQIKFLDSKNGHIQFVTLSFELTSVLHPSGRCCRAVVPVEASKMIIVGLLMKVILEENIAMVEGFHVYLSDRESANVYNRNKFNVEGVELEAGLKQLGYILYNLKIYKKIFLENNKKYACKNYAYTGDYNQVIKLILTMMTISIFNFIIIVFGINLS